MARTDDLTSGDSHVRIHEAIQAARQGSSTPALPPAHQQLDRRFGFEGELLEMAPPYRQVTTQRMIGTPGADIVNELTLTALPTGTLLAVVMSFPDVDTRDAILATGMTDGMETSYARLETEVLA